MIKSSQTVIFFIIDISSLEITEIRPTIRLFRPIVNPDGCIILLT